VEAAGEAVGAAGAVEETFCLLSVGVWHRKGGSRGQIEEAKPEKLIVSINVVVGNGEIQTHNFCCLSQLK
jgi:hypothetical protein